MLEAKEFRELKRRRFKPYSAGHQAMYEVPLALMKRNDRSAARYLILEIGFGIGWGLDRMVENGIVGALDRYVGYEPDEESFDFVFARHGKRSGITLINAAFGAVSGLPFDHIFCIEVIEHVPAVEHAGFLGSLRSASRSGTLWLSTPDSQRNDHGVRPAAEWRAMLKNAGFSDVTVHQDQWTTLFVCQ
ncbi:MAG: methyltransferase domain-containing protein [Bauldia sp.]|nr:methyltransferase domain-containing protein [Bauldia sp.]